MVDMTTVTRTCLWCRQVHEVKVPTDGWERWQDGEYVQVAFPDLTAAEREVLISGTHDECWDEMMGDEE